MLRNDKCQLEASGFFGGGTKMNQGRLHKVFNCIISYHFCEKKDLKQLCQNFKFSIILYSYCFTEIVCKNRTKQIYFPSYSQFYSYNKLCV